MIGIIYKFTILAKYKKDEHKPFYIGQHWCESADIFLCRDYPYYGSGSIWNDFLNRLKKDYPDKWRYFIKREILCIITNNSQKTLNKLEGFWIKREKSHYSYRLGGCNVLFGSIVDFCLTKDPEIRKKLSKTKKEWFRTHEAPWKGRIMPEEQKEHLRHIMTGRKLSEETRKKISKNHHDVSGIKNPNYGNGNAIRGDKNPMKNPEIAKRNAELRKGKKRTDEQKMRMSEGRKHIKYWWSTKKGSKNKLKKLI